MKSFGKNLLSAQKRHFSQEAAQTTNKKVIERDLTYVAHNYGPMPIAVHRAEGIYMWDVEGKRYMDFLSGIGSVNQGHSHPKILKALEEQARKLTMTSRAFYNDQMGVTSEYLCKLMGYDKFLPMNGGVEATETSVKLARRWAYRVKGVPSDQAVVIMAKGCFWGRTITAAGGSDDPVRKSHFGPFTPGFELVDYNDVDAVKQQFESNPNICAIMLEPIQGEKGIIVPAEGYLAQVKALCEKHNVLLISDEVQTGFGRTGKLMAYEWDGIKPDMVCMGKSLSGGIMPVSGVLANDEVMLTIKPGDHGSTYGGNPLAMAVSRAAVQTLVEEGMIENSLKMGDILHDQLSSIRSPLIKEVRGKGLFRAIEFIHDIKATAGDFAHILVKNGIATRQIDNHSIKLMPPLVINEKQVLEASKIVKESVKELERVNKDKMV